MPNSLSSTSISLFKPCIRGHYNNSNVRKPNENPSLKSIFVITSIPVNNSLQLVNKAILFYAGTKTLRAMYNNAKYIVFLRRIIYTY